MFYAVHHLMEKVLMYFNHSLSMAIYNVRSLSMAHTINLHAKRYLQVADYEVSNEFYKVHFQTY